MANFAFIHGAGDVGWYWHLVEAELQARGHDTVAPDLPIEDDKAGLTEFATAVVDAIHDRRDVVVVAQSFCRNDRFFPARWLRPVVRDRLGIEPVEIDTGHCPALSRPRELAGLLDRYSTETTGGGRATPPPGQSQDIAT